MSIYKRFDLLLCDVQESWRFHHLLPDIKDVFAFVRWVLRIIAYLFVIVSSCYFIFQWQFWVKSIDDTFLFLQDPIWARNIRNVAVVLMGVGIGGSIIRLFQFSYDYLNSLLVSQNKGHYKLLLWAVTALSITNISASLLWLYGRPSITLPEAMQSVFWFVLFIIFLPSMFVGSLVLFAFPNLSAAIPLSLGYRHALESRNQSVVKKTVFYLKNNFSTEEYPIVESLLKARLEEKGITGSGLEISVGLLGLIIALIATLPIFDGETFRIFTITLNIQSLRTDYSPLLLIAAISGLVWYFLNLRALKGEELHILLLATQACIIADYHSEGQDEPDMVEEQSSLFANFLKTKIAKLSRYSPPTPIDANGNKDKATGFSSRIDQIICLAEKSGNDPWFRQLVAIAQCQHMFIQPAQNALVFMPSSSYRRPLFLVHGESTDTGNVIIDIFPKIFSSYYFIDEGDVIGMLGNQGRHELSFAGFERFVGCLEELLVNFPVDSQGT